MESESEMRMEWDDPVKYWQERSRRALESQGVVVPRRQVDHPPPEVIEIRRRGYQPIGLDLICNICGRHIPKSTLAHLTIVYYSPYGPVGSPHTRYFTRCIHCLARLELGRNIGDVETLVVMAGATVTDEYNIPNEISAKANLQNEISAKPSNLQNEFGEKVSPLDPVSTQIVMENLRNPTSRTDFLRMIQQTSRMEFLRMIHGNGYHPSVDSDSESDLDADSHAHI